MEVLLELLGKRSFSIGVAKRIGYKPDVAWGHFREGITCLRMKVAQRKSREERRMKMT